jgi:hypothetical protein
MVFVVIDYFRWTCSIEHRAGSLPEIFLPAVYRFGMHFVIGLASMNRRDFAQLSISALATSDPLLEKAYVISNAWVARCCLNGVQDLTFDEERIL